MAIFLSDLTYFVKHWIGLRGEDPTLEIKLCYVTAYILMERLFFYVIKGIFSLAQYLAISHRKPVEDIPPNMMVRVFYCKWTINVRNFTLISCAVLLVVDYILQWIMVHNKAMIWFTHRNMLYHDTIFKGDWTGIWFGISYDFAWQCRRHVPHLLGNAITAVIHVNIINQATLVRGDIGVNLIFMSVVFETQLLQTLLAIHSPYFTNIRL